MSTSLHLDEYLEYGIDRQQGNLLGVQPYLFPEDYTSGESLFNKLQGYVEAARLRDWINPRTIIVFPEYIGAWLMIAGEKPGLYRRRTIQQTGIALALAHPLRFAQSFLASRANNRIQAALFSLNAHKSARLYQQVFSRLAQEFAVTVVAGSTLLPQPQIKNGVITAGSGPVFNFSAVFQPDGNPYSSLVRKVYPTQSEQPFLQAGSLADLPVFETPAGRLGVLVCADAWFPGSYQRLKTLNTDLVAVPSFVGENRAWNKPWGGYSGWPFPPDADRADVGRISEGEAWRKYTLPTRLGSGGAKAGINVFLHGELWELGSDCGTSWMVSGDEVIPATTSQAAVLNLWL